MTSPLPGRRPGDVTAGRHLVRDVERLSEHLDRLVDDGDALGVGHLGPDLEQHVDHLLRRLPHRVQIGLVGRRSVGVCGVLRGVLRRARGRISRGLRTRSSGVRLGLSVGDAWLACACAADVAVSAAPWIALAIVPAVCVAVAVGDACVGVADGVPDALPVVVVRAAGELISVLVAVALCCGSGVPVAVAVAVSVLSLSGVVVATVSESADDVSVAVASSCVASSAVGVADGVSAVSVALGDATFSESPEGVIAVGVADAS